jgi:CRP-like cAMP-binding protein
MIVITWRSRQANRVMINAELLATASRRSPLIASLPAHAQAALRLRQVGAGKHLFRRGEQPRSLHFVVSGEIHLVRRSRTGREIVLQRARNGFIAEASLDQAAYHCDGLARLPSDVLVLPRSAFHAALADVEFRTGWMGHLTRELRRVRAQAERLSLRSARDRIIHYLETEGVDGRVELTITRKDWASELGLSHEALYRTLASMEDDGELRTEGNVVALVA